MKYNIKNITVIGDGGWGTTLCVHLAKNGYNLSLWGPFPEYLKSIEKSRVNTKFLPGIKLPKNVHTEPNLKKAVESSELIVFAIPSKFALSVIKKIKKTKVSFKNKIFLSVTKGIDTKNDLRISQMVKKELGNITFAALSGPNIAPEVARGVPSTAVIASINSAAAKAVQKAVNNDTFRIYTNKDIVGVEIGGSIKNIIAIACGLCDGLKYGANTKAAILTRGLNEMNAFGKALGAKTKTLAGLSGLGDMVTTCFSPKSRNRSVGEQLGKGKNIKKITNSMQMVAEGVETVKAVHHLALKKRISMPITEQVYEIIYKNKKPALAVKDLMSRKLRSE